MQLTVVSAEPLPNPLIEISNSSASVDPMPVILSAISKNELSTTYSFPMSVFTPAGNWRVSTTFVRGDLYDVQSSIGFKYPEDVAGGSRRFDRYTWSIMLLVLVALFATAWRVVCVLRNKDVRLDTAGEVPARMAHGIAVIALAALLAALYVIATR